MHFYNPSVLGIIWSLINQVQPILLPPFPLKFVLENFNHICPKKPAPSILYYVRLYGFAALEIHVRVCAPSIFARR